MKVKNINVISVFGSHLLFWSQKKNKVAVFPKSRCIFKVFSRFIKVRKKFYFELGGCNIIVNIYYFDAQKSFPFWSKYPTLIIKIYVFVYYKN